MVILHKKPRKPNVGTKREYTKFLWVPLRHKDKTYIWCSVHITEVYTKDYISVYVDGGGWYEDGWKITKVELV